MSRKTTFCHVSDTFWNVSFLLRSRKRQFWDQNHPISFLFSVSHGFWCRALCYPSCSIVRGMSPIVSSWNVLYHDMQFAPQEDATHHGNVSQQEDGRSIPGLVGATRHLQLPTLEEKQLLQIFLQLFCKKAWSRLPSLRWDEDATFPKTPLLSLPWLCWVSATLLSSHSFAFSRWKIAFSH